MKYRYFLKSGFSFISLLCCISGVAYFQNNNLKQLNTGKNKEIYQKEQEQFSAVAKIQNKIPSFGYSNLLADWAFLQFIQYFGDGEARDVTGYSTVTDYFEEIVHRDPNFVQAFLVLSSANSLFAARPAKTVALMNQILEKVDPNAPNYPFMLWTYKATDEILFLGDIPAAKNSYLMAANWANQHSSDLGNDMAQRFHKTADFLASEPDPAQAQFGSWMNLLNSSFDPKTQYYIVNKLQDLGAEIEILPNGRLNVKPPKFSQA